MTDALPVYESRLFAGHEERQVGNILERTTAAHRIASGPLLYELLEVGGPTLPRDMSIRDCSCQRRQSIPFYVDSVNTFIYDDMWIYITHFNSSGEDEILITKKVSSLSDSIEISMGHVLRAYQSGNLGIYDKFNLKAGGTLYNYSQLSIQNNPRLDIMYTK